MADNVLAQVPRKRYPTLDEQMRSDIVNYLSRLKSDFVTSGERAGQGLGQVIDDGNYLEGVPRVVLGGLGALSAPVSAAVSPVLGPLLQPVGEAVDTYVGQPIEQATGYPADITNEVFLTTATAGMAPLLKPALKGSGNFLAKMGDAAEAGLNRVGYTARPQAGTFFSGGGPVKLADDVAEGGGLLSQPADVGSGVGLRPNAGEAIDATNSVFRAHPADSQVTGNMRLSPTLSSSGKLDGIDIDRAVRAHNDQLDTIQQQYDSLGDRKPYYTELERKDVENTWGDLEDAPSEIRDAIAKHGKVIEISDSGGNYTEWFSPDKAPSYEDFMRKALEDENFLHAPATSLDDVYKNLSLGTSVAENAAAMSLKSIAADLGWESRAATRNNWNRYQEMARRATPEELARVKAAGNDPEDYKWITMKVRVSDHGNLSSQHEAPTINLAPGAHDFNDAIDILKNATIDGNGRLIAR